MSRFAAPLSIRPSPGGRVPTTAMVLCAGLGKRMRPLTATRPKPLVEVAGKPLLDHVLDRLRAAGVRRVIVNVHYLADALEAHLKRTAADLEIVISDERGELLETGGGVVRALPLIGEDPFFVVNADNLWIDGPVDTLKLLARRWDEAAMDGLLLVVPYAHANNYQGQGDFNMDPAGILCRRAAGRVASFVYTGVQLVSKRLFADPPAGPFSTNLLWNRAIAKDRLFGFVHQGLWFDVGTPPAIGRTETLLGNG